MNIRKAATMLSLIGALTLGFSATSQAHNIVQVPSVTFIYGNGGVYAGYSSGYTHRGYYRNYCPPRAYYYRDRHHRHHYRDRHSYRGHRDRRYRY